MRAGSSVAISAKKFEPFSRTEGVCNIIGRLLLALQLHHVCDCVKLKLKQNLKVELKLKHNLNLKVGTGTLSTMKEHSFYNSLQLSTSRTLTYYPHTV